MHTHARGHFIIFSLRIDGENRRGVLDEIVERSLKPAAPWDEVKDRLDESALALSGGQQQSLYSARQLKPIRKCSRQTGPVRRSTRSRRRKSRSNASR